MSRPKPDQPLNTSVLDRVMGPDGSAAPANRPPRLEDLKRAAKRDLEMLLNSRCRCIPPPSDLTQLEVSVVNYGIPDFTGADLSTESQRQNFVRQIEETIRRFEPRFTHVEVHKLNNADPEDRTLRLRIEARIHAEPAPEALVFNSVMDPLSSTFRVGDGANG